MDERHAFARMAQGALAALLLMRHQQKGHAGLVERIPIGLHLVFLLGLSQNGNRLIYDCGSSVVDLASAVMAAKALSGKVDVFLARLTSGLGSGLAHGQIELGTQLLAAMRRTQRLASQRDQLLAAQLGRGGNGRTTRQRLLLIIFFAAAAAAALYVHVDVHLHGILL